MTSPASGYDGTCEAVQSHSSLLGLLPTELILQVMLSLNHGELGLFTLGTYHLLSMRGILPGRYYRKLRRLLHGSPIEQLVPIRSLGLPTELNDEITSYLKIEDRVNLFLARLG